MTSDEIRDLFDREQRYDAVFPALRRDEIPPVVRHVGLNSRNSAIVYSQLDDSVVPEIIQREISYFSALGHRFEWKVYDHDQPADLAEQLAQNGFTAEPTEALLVLPVEEAATDRRAPIRHDIRQATHPDQINALIEIQERVWQKNLGWLRDELCDALAHHADTEPIYIAYEDGQPASTGWMTFHPGSQFAALWGGTTLPEYRGRGLYTALLAARVQAARRRGIRYLYVEAGPMSRPILEKRGFRFISAVTAYRYPS